jgi:hypothetical protein
MTLAAPGKPTVVGVGGEVKARRDFVATRPALPVQPFNASTLQLFNSSTVSEFRAAHDPLGSTGFRVFPTEKPIDARL